MILASGMLIDDTGEALAKMSSEIESKGIVGKNPGATGMPKHTEFKKTVDCSFSIVFNLFLLLFSSF